MAGTFGTINKNSAIKCSNVKNNYLSGYGLIVGGQLQATIDRVKGTSYFQTGTELSRIREHDEECPIFTNQSTSLFNFKQAYSDSVLTSMKLSTIIPTLKLDENDVLTRLDTKKSDFDVMTMNTCNEFNCHLYPGMLSDSSHIINGVAKLKDSQGVPLPQKLIINVNIHIITISMSY